MVRCCNKFVTRLTGVVFSLQLASVHVVVVVVVVGDDWVLSNTHPDPIPAHPHTHTLTLGLVHEGSKGSGLYFTSCSTGSHLILKAEFIDILCMLSLYCFCFAHLDISLQLINTAADKTAQRI